KTLIFAKDDSHADDIVKIVREEFDKGNDFCQKITYRTTGASPKELIQRFRNSPNPRIAVTVDMIATGTDIKPLEIVMFMRSVKSGSFFEQMKGRGVRVISDTDFQSVTPDAKTKTHFVIVDAVGVCERDKTDSRPLEQKDLQSASEKLAKEAATVIASNPDLRNKILAIQRAADQTIDTVSQDKLLFAGADAKTTEAARDTIKSFRDYIEQHKAEI